MILDSPHTSAPRLMRGYIPATTRFPPHRSRPTGNPPNLQPVTVGEEERGGRDPTSRRTPMRAAPDCRQPPTARHALQPRSSNTRHPPQQQDTAHREGGQSRRRTAAQRRTSGCGPRPGPAPAAVRPAAAALYGRWSRRSAKRAKDRGPSSSPRCVMWSRPRCCTLVGRLPTTRGRML